MDLSSTMSRFMSSRSTSLTSSSAGTTSKNLSGKRKVSSAVYQDCGDKKGRDKNARESHSQIEKRRRDKMNSFIDELASLVPTCNTKSRKLDKLSVLRMAVQHIKTLQSSTAKLFTEVNHKPAFLSDEELKHVIVKAADCFLFVVDCDRGKILFVSESVNNILNYSQNDLIGRSLFDYLHPKDIAKVKEQLSSADTIPQERVINAKSGLSVKADINPCSLRLCSGVRRSFFCRMKCNRPLLNMDDEDFSSTCANENAECKSLCTIHSTGYLKSWSPTEVDENNELDSDGCNSSCLVAVGRLHPDTVSQPVQNDVKVKPMEFVSRHAIDGKFVFVDQRATAILAYLPQELLGTSFYEYFHEDDIAHLSECHWQVLQMRKRINTNCYKLKIKDGSFITLRSHWFRFLNPWTKEVEYIVSTNTVVIPAGDRDENSYHQPASSPQRRVTVQVPGDNAGKLDLHTVPGIPGGMRESAGKIGRMIAEELLGIQRMDISTVISNSQRVSEASATLENLVAKGTEKERDKQARDYSTTQEVKTSEEDAFGALGAAEEAQFTGQTEGGRDLLEADVIDYAGCMSAIPSVPSS